MEGTQEARSETRIKCWKIATELWLWISFRFGTNRFFRNPHMEVDSAEIELQQHKALGYTFGKPCNVVS